MRCRLQRKAQYEVCRSSQRTVIKERPLSSGASDKKATQPAQTVHR
ncbi:hypothetical protein GPK80_13005, partial [Coprococcus comes]|nr:hypothetical protein [Coprococcus comes]